MYSLSQGSSRCFLQFFLFFYVTLPVCIKDHLVYFRLKIWFINITFMASIQIPERIASCWRKTLITILFLKNVCTFLVYEWCLASNSGILTTVPSSLRIIAQGLRTWVVELEWTGITFWHHHSLAWLSTSVLTYREPQVSQTQMKDDNNTLLHK